MKMTGGKSFLSPQKCPEEFSPATSSDLGLALDIVLREDLVRAFDSFLRVFSCLFLMAANL
jgi:hypothetical protein